ncbi:MAG: phage Gp37/Gp68 family protein [bacterium]
MSANSEISWCHHTFNPWWGCTKVSEGCLRCYALIFSRRLGKDIWGAGVPRVRGSENVWMNPLIWNRKAEGLETRPRVFVASMADVFDDEVDGTWRDDLWNLIRVCPNLDWLLLTKRPQNIHEMLPEDWGNGWPHVWLGVTVENQARALERIPILRSIPAALRFLSVEPLLGPVDLDLDDIDWVILGGESGAGYRLLDPKWARGVRDQCLRRGIPFHFKQWGTARPAFAGRLLDGKIWNGFPVSPAGLLV